MKQHNELSFVDYQSGTDKVKLTILCDGGGLRERELHILNSLCICAGLPGSEPTPVVQRTRRHKAKDTLLLGPTCG